MEKLTTLALPAVEVGRDPIREHLRAELAAAQAKKREAAAEAMLRRVPRRFHDSRFATYRPHNESQVAALEAAQTWVAAVLAGEHPMLALIGDTGVGKSHLLWAAAWALFEQSGRLPFVARWATRFADELRWGRGPRDERGNPAESPTDVRRWWYAEPFSLIDEMRPTSGTEHDAGELAKYAMHAYDELIPVFGTTNMADLASIMGAPAADRFQVVVLRGQSER